MGKKNNKYKWQQVADHPYADDLGTWIDLRLMQLAGDARALILVAHGYIELLVNTITKECCRHGSKIASDDKLYPHAMKLVILNELGLIENDLYLKLDLLRGIRNSVAHQPFYDVDASKLAELGVSESFQLDSVLMRIIACLHARHLEILAPVVFPNMTPLPRPAYRKEYAKLSREWVDIMEPLIQEHGWKCERCGWIGTDFKASRPPEHLAWNNESYIFCRKCLQNVSIPEKLIRERCGMKPKRPANSGDIRVESECFDLRTMERIELPLSHSEGRGQFDADGAPIDSAEET